MTGGISFDRRHSTTNKGTIRIMSREKNEKNIIRFKKVRRFNPIFIFLALILGYIALVVYSYFHRTHLTPILVEPISIKGSDVITGLIIRDEKVVTSEAAGNINFYVQDGEKVGADTVIYTVDETGEEGLVSRYFHEREEAIQYLSTAGNQAALRATTLEDVFVEVAGRKLT